jgi:glucokinase
MNDLALAIDVGATKVAVGLVSRDGSVISRTEISSKSDSMSELNERLASAIRGQVAQSTSPITGAGIGSAGPIDHFKGTINPVNISQWVDFSLVDFVRTVSGIADVHLIGDASALAYAEFCIGAGQGAKNLLGVVVSTGIGGGTVLDGKFFAGQYGNAGFIGHTIVQIDGELCACGARGCVEAYSSGTNMSRLAGMANFEEVAAAARSGNATAISVIDQGSKVLAAALVNAVATMDLDTIVIGGGVINAADVYWQPLKNHFEKQLAYLKFPGEVVFKRATLGKDSGLIGAGLVGFISVDQREGAL